MGGIATSRIEDVVKPQREAPVRESLADEIHAIGTGEIQTRADIARALGREPDESQRRPGHVQNARGGDAVVARLPGINAELAAVSPGLSRTG